METLDQRITEFRDRVVREWAGDETAHAWQKHFRIMHEQLANVTQTLVDAAAPQAGEVILDLASGNGEPSLSLAKAVAPGGKVVATDLSEFMLAALRENAAAEGISNLETEVVDAHAIPFPDASFDAVTSRFGVMFFVEIERALAEIKRALKPGGRIAFLVWGAPEPGTYFGAAAVPFMRRLPVRPDPDAPAPMRYAEPGKLLRVVQSAGFDEVRESSYRLPASFPGSPQEMLDLMMEIAAPFRNAATTLSPEDRQAAEDEAIANLGALYDGARINVVAPAIVVTAFKR